MNERIRELINEATSGPKWVPLYKIDNVLLEKFAELIVRECARVAAKNQAEDMSWNISEIIKEHFGVEE